MDGLSGAASIVAVIDISVKITSLCFQYSAAVKAAKDDIARVQRKADNIAHILNQMKQIFDGQDETRLNTTQGLSGSLEQCLKDLEPLKVKLEPGKARKAISRVGLRALKWPFTSKQVDKIVMNLEQYVQTFSSALQIDQTAVVLNMDQKLDLAKLPIAQGASYDSHMEEHNARCLPNTRTTLLHDIKTWVQDQGGKPIFWLSGMAGTGKSTIARTVAESLASHGQLGASFFFKRGEGERGNASLFFTTLATDLAAHEPRLLSGIRKTLDEDSTISHKALKEQFEKLILQPILGIQTSSPVLARVIVIDALDECEREADIRTILQLLARTKDICPVPLRVIVTSRPELHIRLGFREMPDGTHQDLVLHEVPRSTIEHDIRLFLEHELSIIRKERNLSLEWPTKRQIFELVELAVPLFIYAATVCRYIGSKGSSPAAFLTKVLQYKKATFLQLDRTYLPVLDQLLSEQEEDEKETWLQAFREIVGSIVVLQSPLSIVSLGRLLQISKEEIQNRIDSLHSVLSIPDSEDAPVRLLHLSFREFLIDTQKQGKSSFWVDEKIMHKKLASRCLKIMSGPSGLHQDMCSLLGPGTLSSEIDDARITNSLSPDLLYACRYWIDHLKQGQQEIFDGDTTHLFLQKHFLHWLEAMSLIGESNRCVNLLNNLQTLVNVRSANLLLSFLDDAKRFVLRFQFVLADAPLQVYCSALMFAPERSIVRQTFVDQVPVKFEILSMKETDWGACYSTLEGHSSRVTAVAFSPDAQLIVSASQDTTLQLWEADTGSCRSTLEGHSEYITTAIFSPDGQLLASACSQTVRIWNVTTGTCCNTLEGHPEDVLALAFLLDGQLLGSACNKMVRLWDVKTGTCRSVLEAHYWATAAAFSPNGQLVALGSLDKVQLLDTETGMCRNTFEGQFSFVEAVAFSPNARLLVSASRDEIVRLWDTEAGTCRAMFESHSDNITKLVFSLNGQLVALVSEDAVQLWDVETGTDHRILEGHSEEIIDMAFSPDGQLVVLASDKTVQLWETATGKCYNTFEGHSRQITAVAFSPNAQLVASASSDATVRLWKVEKETYHGTFESHSDRITRLVFSPYGQFVASLSWDRTVRLWEAGTGVCRSILKGHTHDITGVSFSPDEQLVASSSFDNTVRLWEIATGICRSILKGHSRDITAAIFSPDGHLVASSSWDKTVRLWDVATGTCRSTLEGHSRGVKAVIFSPDRQLIASTSFDNTVRLWEVETGKCRSILGGHSEDITAILFSPDGQLIMSASLDNTVRLWEVRSGVCRSVLEGHSEDITAVDFSPDGQLIVSASFDNTVRLWDVATGTCRSTLNVSLGYRPSLHFSPDSQVLHTSKGVISLSASSLVQSLPRPQSPLPHLRVEHPWILRNEQRLLWLPSEYRTYVTRIRGDVVCLGLGSGRVVLLRIP